jgi:threonine/homoserine/homoserine lactone efflux protein
MAEYLIFGITYAFAAAVQPGPLQTYFISQALEHGWQKTLPAALAPLISDGPILILVLFLLSNVPGLFILMLRIAGGIFLIYLGARAFISWKNYTARDITGNKSDRQTLIKAALINFLNPAPYLSWSLIMGPIFLAGWRIAPANGFILLSGFYSTLIATSAGIIILFGLAGKIGTRITRVLLGISSVLLIAFGVYQLWLGFFGE